MIGIQAIGSTLVRLALRDDGLPRVLRVHRVPRFVERLLRRFLSGDDRADRELQLLRYGRIDQRRRARVAVDQHLAEAAEPRILAENRKVAIDAAAHRQMTGRLGDARGVRRPFDVADELDRGLAPLRILGEYHPDPAAGSGRPRARVGLRNRRDIPLRELVRRQAGLQILELPVAAEKHRGIAGDGGAGHLLVIGLAEHRARRGAALDRVAQEAEQPQHRGPVRTLAEDRPAVAIDQLAALRPEHREVIEDGAFPSAGVVEIAGHLLLARDAAGGVEQFAPGARRHRHQILAVEQHAAVGLVPHAEDVTGLVGQRLDRERQEVGAIVGRPVGFERLYVVREQRQPVAVDRCHDPAAGPPPTRAAAWSCAARARASPRRGAAQPDARAPSRRARS